MNCEKYRDIILKSFDGKLNNENEKALEMHLKECRDCREFQQSFQRLSKSMENIKAPEPSRELMKRTKKSFYSKPDRRGIFISFRVLGYACAGLVIFAAGFLMSNYLHKSQELDVIKLQAGKELNCRNLFDINYAVDPYSIYRSREEEFNAVTMKEEQSPISVPERVMSHGPYSIAQKEMKQTGENLCIPYVSPFGQVIVLSSIPTKRKPKDKIFILTGDESKTLYHSVSWFSRNRIWTIEGRLQPEYLMDIAEELQKAINKNSAV